jgi:hypothetical protein
MVQVRSVCDRPLLTVSDRQMPLLRARRGHDRRGASSLGSGSNDRKLTRRVRPVRDDHCRVGKRPDGAHGRLAPTSKATDKEPADQDDDGHEDQELKG